MQVSLIVKEIGAKRRVQIDQAVQDLTDVGALSSDSRFSCYVSSKDSWEAQTSTFTARTSETQIS